MHWACKAATIPMLYCYTAELAESQATKGYTQHGRPLILHPNRAASTAIDLTALICMTGLQGTDDELA